MESRTRVLLIDDDVDFVSLNKAFLERRYLVEVAFDGQEGMAKARKMKPDVIVLDVMMADIDEGFDVAREICSDPELRGTSVIMLSSVNRLLRPMHFEPDPDWLPVSAFLDKPISPERLAEEIERLVPRRS